MQRVGDRVLEACLRRGGRTMLGHRLAGAAAGQSCQLPRPPAGLHGSLGSQADAARHRMRFASRLGRLPLPAATTALPRQLTQRGSATAPTAAAPAAAPAKVPKAVRDYWESVLSTVDKPTAKKLLPFVDAALPLGLPPPVKGAAGRKGSRPPLYKFYLTIKDKHPTKVVLVRVGEFYEAVGIDAVLLVQHAGLNPMGDGDPPRAGCPRVNMRRTVADLVEGAGLSVVVCEELAEPYSYGSMRSRLKERYIAAVVTPASPHLLHGLVDEDADLALDSSPPLLGVTPRVGGYAVIEVDAELLTVRVTEGLTEDAVCARLHEGGLAPPLYVHVPPPSATSDARLSEATAEGEWGRRVAAIFRSEIGAVARYGGSDAVGGMVEEVRKQLALPSGAQFRVLTNLAKDRPRPLYFSTATNLGLHKTRGIPSLLDCVLPPGAPLAARRWLRRLLLLPPAPAVGLAVQAACRALADAEAAVPSFPVMAPANVVLKLRSKEANDTFFRELVDLCHAVEAACTSPSLVALSEALLVPATAETGISADRRVLAEACAAAQREIHAVVDHDTGVGTGLRGERGGQGGEGSGGEDEEGEEGGGQGEPLSALQQLFDKNEGYMGRVRADKLETYYAKVNEARERVQAEALDALARASAPVPNLPGDPVVFTSRGKAKASQPALYMSVANNAVWLRLPRGSAAAAQSKRLKFDHPKDRFGKVEAGAFSTARLELALDDYRRACSEAENAVRSELRALALRLEAMLPRLVCAATFAVVAAALDSHVREAARRGWGLPQLNYGPDAASAGGQSGQGQGALEVDGMWPYWLDQLHPKTVRNSFSMQAGKSTLLRSTCAVALLGSCGLLAPVASASLPYLDAFMLRSFSSDSPLEGRSSFAVEMMEMRYLLEDATADSLVLVDELGKGTEVRAGSALAGSMLEALEVEGCKGVFATHLHQLLEMDLQLATTARMRMEVGVRQEQVGGGGALQWRRRPTWRMVPGTSTESLALEVAQDSRLPGKVIARAAQLYIKALAPLATPAAVAVGSPSQGSSDEGPPQSGTLSVGSSKPEQQGQATAGPPQDRNLMEELDKVAALLENTSREVLWALARASSARSSQGGVGDATFAWMAAMVVEPGELPPADTVGASCVYVAQRSDGWYYVGSTDALTERIDTHRRRNSRGSRVADPRAEFLYISLAGRQGGLSAARAVEKAVIMAMQDKGYPMLSTEDAKHRHSPKGLQG